MEKQELEGFITGQTVFSPSRERSTLLHITPAKIHKCVQECAILESNFAEDTTLHFHVSISLCEILHTSHRQHTAPPPVIHPTPPTHTPTHLKCLQLLPSACRVASVNRSHPATSRRCKSLQFSQTDSTPASVTLCTHREHGSHHNIHCFNVKT